MSESNQAQIELWNGRVGEKWVALQDPLDAMLAHASRELRARVGSVTGQRVLDIGCGNGETCLFWLDGGAEVTGVDVSAPMLAVAAKRTLGRVTLIEADASTWRGNAPFDLATSRFGVMFFDDPVAAFTNIAANLRRGGRLVFTCWRTLTENPWASVAVNAVRDLLPPTPPVAPNAPGPYALADKTRLQGILEGAGFKVTAIDAVDFPIGLAAQGGVEAALPMAMQFGPLGVALAEADDRLKAAVAERLRPVLAAYERDGAVSMQGAVWMVEAVAL